MLMIKKIVLSSLILAAPSGLIQAANVPADEFYKVDTVATGLVDAMEIAVLPTGDVFIAERTGALKWYSPTKNEVKLVKQFDVSVKKADKSRETGLLGITADPNFMKTGWVYAYYSPIEKEEHRLSRFTFKAGALSDEKILLSVDQSRNGGVCHEGGSLAFDGKGNLFLSLGDNTNPFKSEGYPPHDERVGNEHINSQRTSGNSNDLRGKVIRIKPTPNGSYEIPDGNLFPKGTPKTRPEIFAMGCRNPWRIGVDKETGTVYWGDVGPDAKDDSPRGPRGYCEINQASTAGYYGWPYFVADNKPYFAYDFEKNEIGKAFDPANPENNSRLNTGLKKLPASRKPLWFEKRSCYCAGPVYHFDKMGASKESLPEELDNCLLTYDWNNGRMQLTKLNKSGEMQWKEDWLHSKKFIHPSDVEVGSDGIMYVLEYGSSWYDSTDGKLKKVTYSKEGHQVLAQEGPDPRIAGMDPKHPGTNIISQAICLSCHQTQVRSVGPSLVEVATRYRDKPEAAAMLTQKIIKGGAGAWGEVPMPPNAQYNEEQVSQIVDAILTMDLGGHKE
jgi:cytochrome c